MALTPRLDLRQSQSLVMTPQLQQAIKLLQLSNMELLEYVEQELEQNPLLERDDVGDDLGSIGGPDGEGGERGASPEADGGWDLEGGSDGALQSVDFDDHGRDIDITGGDMDVEIDNQWNTAEQGDGPLGPDMSENAFSDWGSGGAADFGGGTGNLEETLSGDISLRDHLSGQMAMTLFDPADRIIGGQLIDMLSDAGYLAGDLEQVAENLDCPLERVERVLEILQGLDPIGIFARDLAECLSLQLKEKDRLDPAMRALLANLDLLAKRDIAALIDICGVDGEDIADMIGEIRDLNPRPAEAFEAVVAAPVVPDVVMRARPGNQWAVELNAETLPRVLVNNTYFATINRASTSKADKQYINDCLQSANWLVRSLHQRATTILKVATEIVRQQDAFFARGVRHLRPLVLRDIAEAIEMHESTVSRVTSNKYMSTPRGIFELKYFFSASIGSSSGGDAHSAEAVRHRIRAMIDGESTDKILSDDKIVEELRRQGVDIARRTVAKYRESMRISSSVQRRREKRSWL